MPNTAHFGQRFPVAQVLGRHRRGDVHRTDDRFRHRAVAHQSRCYSRTRAGPCGPRSGGTRDGAGDRAFLDIGLGVTGILRLEQFAAGKHPVLKSFVSLRCIRRAMIRQAVHEPLDPFTNEWRQIRPQLRKRHEAVIHVAGHHLGTGLPLEGIVLRQREVINTAQRVEVRARVQGGAFELLGCHEENAPHDGALLVHLLDGRLGW